MTSSNVFEGVGAVRAGVATLGPPTLEGLQFQVNPFVSPKVTTGVKRSVALRVVTHVFWIITRR